MRRLIPTLILTLTLLAGGGLAISTRFSPTLFFRGYYVPSLNADPEKAQTQVLLFIGGVLVGTFLIVAMGAGLAFAFHQFTKLQGAGRLVGPSPSRPEAPSKTAPKPSLEAPQIPLSNARSLAVFWVGVLSLTGAYFALGYEGKPLGYVPNLLVTATMTPVPTATRVPGGGLEALPKGDATAGKTVFTAAGCGVCHSLEPNVKIVGPSLAGVATRATTRKPGYSAERYLYESITNPNAYVVEGFAPDLMPKTFKDTLSPQDLANVMAFLLTQK